MHRRRRSPCCGIVWSSLAKSAGTVSSAALSDVRAVWHASYDRLVFDIAGQGAGFPVGYVSAIHRQGSAANVDLRGGAFLPVSVLDPVYNVATEAPTDAPANPNELINTAGFATFRRVVMAGSFESVTTASEGLQPRPSGTCRRIYRG
ncbi:AMIN-like domain-containing (lipo)protein [Arthrobacter alpinus]|uniref:AMIN-like domain-containing (lipo)protein n=1 Tax=Arthrobacter alpinus TaxID=656366 RepID=UPI0007857C9C|nr:hypothetical protein [Arthrobacter alpinus]